MIPAVPRQAGTLLAAAAIFATGGGCRGESSLAVAQPSDPVRPNIVIIVADDLGYADICAYGCPVGRTPHIDSIGEAGIRFTDGYVSAPICSPSRAGLMTGRYQQRFGHEFNAGGAARSHRLGLGTPTDQIMLPARLQEAGYVTGMFGKWHLGSKPDLHPMARGFDEFFGFLHGANHYLDPLEQEGVHYVQATEAGNRPHRDLEVNPILRGRKPVDEPEYLTDAITREAVAFVERHRGEPFFLYVPYNAPHTPLQVTDEYYDRFPEISDRKQRIFAAMVSAVDDGVGAILGALRDHQLEERTLVVFLSDNGCATYTEACFNEPLSFGKLLPFEGGVRVPFLAQWKGVITPRQVLGTPVSALDLMPTALELAGIEATGELDGQSLVSLFRGEDRLADRALFWRNGGNWGVREGRWKLVILNERYELLFDLESDVGETRDVAGEHPDVLERLRGAFEEWSQEMRDPLWPTKGTIQIPLPVPGQGLQTIEIWI